MINRTLTEDTGTMKHSVTALILTLTVTTASAVFSTTPTIAADGKSIKDVGKSRQIRIESRKLRIGIKNNSKKIDISKSNRPSVAIVDNEKKPKIGKVFLKIEDKEKKPKFEQKPVILITKKDDEDVAQKRSRIRVVNNDDDEVAQKRPRIRVVENNDDDVVTEKKPTIKVVENNETVEETNKVDEDVFAPQAKVETTKVEIPTVFNEKQKALFDDLEVDEQVVVVKRLIKKYGYDALYPTQTKAKFHNNYSTKQYKYKKRHSQYKYKHKQRNKYRNSYNYSSRSKHHNGYRYNKRSSYGCRY